MTLPPAHWWRTVFFLIPAIAIYTIVLGLASLLSLLFDRCGHAAHRCAQWWARAILRTTRRHGRAAGRAAAAGHHELHLRRQSLELLRHSGVFRDAAASAAHHGEGGARLRAVHRLAPALVGHLLVDRKNPGASIFKRMQRLTTQGASLLVFPEGSRTRDGRVKKFKGGVFLLAIETGWPVVPVSIVGSRTVMPAGRLMTCPATVQLIVHDPIPTAGLTRDDARGLAERVREIVASARSSGWEREMDLIVAVRCRRDRSPGLGRRRSGARRRARSAARTSRCGRARRRCAHEASPPRSPPPCARCTSGPGLDPTKTRPSSEALLRRVRKGDELPRINSLVDVINWCSLESQLPFGLYDLDHVRGAVTLRLGRAGEEYPGIRKDVVHVADRLVLADDEGPFGNPTSDSARTMVTPSTIRALVVIFAPVSVEASVGARALQLTTRADRAVLPCDVRRTNRFTGTSGTTGPRNELALAGFLWF